MTLLQISALTQEPIVEGGLLALAAGVIGWFAVQAVATLKKVDRIMIAIWGDEADPVPNGLKRTVTKLAERLDMHIEEFRTFDRGITRTLGPLAESVHLNTQERLLRAAREHTERPGDG